MLTLTDSEAPEAGAKVASNGRRLARLLGSLNLNWRAPAIGAQLASKAPSYRPTAARNGCQTPVPAPHWVRGARRAQQRVAARPQLRAARGPLLPCAPCPQCTRPSQHTPRCPPAARRTAAPAPPAPRGVTAAHAGAIAGSRQCGQSSPACCTARATFHGPHSPPEHAQKPQRRRAPSSICSGSKAWSENGDRRGHPCV